MYLPVQILALKRTYKKKPNKSKLCCVKIKTLHFWNLVGLLLIWFSKEGYEGLAGYLVEKALTTHCVEISIELPIHLH